MSYSRPKTYWIEHAVIPGKGFVKIKLPHLAGQSLRKTFNMFGYLSFSLDLRQINEKMPWMTGKIAPQIKLICWNYVNDNKISPYSSPHRRALVFKKKVEK